MIPHKGIVFGQLDCLIEIIQRSIKLALSLLDLVRRAHLRSATATTCGHMLRLTMPTQPSRTAL